VVGVTSQQAAIDNLLHLINNGTPQNASFQLVDLNLIKAIDVGRSSRPASGDLDADGDRDLFLGNADGQIIPYTNTGSAIAPSFVRGSALRDASNAIIDVGTGAAPVWIDFESDGDLDLFVGAGSPGRVRYYRNEGTPQARLLVLQSSQFAGVQVDFNATPALGDLDADGDLDLLVGEFGTTGNPRLFYMRNDGSTQNPVWVMVSDNTPNTFVFAQRVWNGDIVPELVNLDGDGDLDLLIGERDGNVNFYRNTGTPQAFTFTLQSQAFAGARVGFESATEALDVNGDGALDLLIGEQNGGLNYYRRVPPVAVGDPGAAPAAAPRLTAVRPNPTAGGAAVTLELGADASVRAGVYAAGGRLVRFLITRRLGAGTHRLVWDGRDAAGLPAPAGTYFLRVEAGATQLAAKLVVVR
jgi:hypothetical protein